MSAKCSCPPNGDCKKCKTDMPELTKEELEGTIKTMGPELTNLLAKENRINLENGRVYVKNKNVGFGILDTENSMIHVTHDARGRLNQERIVIPNK